MVLAAGLPGVLVAAESSLEDFRWKKRVIVVTPGEASATVDSKLAKDVKGLAERDVVVYFLKEPGGKSGQVADEKLAAELTRRLSVKDGAGEVLLLGKDGRTTLRWKATDFDLAKLYQEIDSMPMRQKEMRK